MDSDYESPQVVRHPIHPVYLVRRRLRPEVTGICRYQYLSPDGTWRLFSSGCTYASPEEATIVLQCLTAPVILLDIEL